MQKQRQLESPLHLKVESIERRLLLIPITYVIIHVWDSCQIVTSFFLSGKVKPSGCTQPYVQRIFLAFGILQVRPPHYAHDIHFLLHN